MTPPAFLVAVLLAWQASSRQGARMALFGILGGFFATLAYDGVRLLLNLLGLVDHPFKSIALYGVLIAGSADSSLARWAGWLFHFWNGASFGMFYAVAFGRPTIARGVIWGLFLELALVATSPRLLGLTIRGELLASSLIGHLAYGLVLACVVRRGTD
jgi:hypothetical protein